MSEEKPFFTAEEWRPIFFGLYEVSSIGRVRDSKKKQIKRQHVRKEGYYGVGLSRNGKAKGALVHRLVCEGFLGQCPKGIVVNHLNGNKKDNRIENLEYVTQRENARHARRLGLTPYATSDILTSRQVRRVKQLLNGAKLYDIEIAIIFNVSNKCIQNIKIGKAWPHVF